MTIKQCVNVLIPVLAASLLAACGTMDIPGMQVKGGAFDQGLRDGYVKLANAEYAEIDITPGNEFAERARLAAMGNPPAPEAISARKLVAPHRQELTDARARLMTALGDGAAQKDGADAASAQVMFDCWMEEAEENNQPDAISYCKNGFLAAMNRVDATLGHPHPMKVSMPATPHSERFVVYFATNSASLDGRAMAIVREAAAKAKAVKAADVYVTGYTDRRGASAYNMKLSGKRADAVSSALMKAGVSKGRIGTMSEGEQHPAVATRNGVSESRNRRVVITILY